MISYLATTASVGVYAEDLGHMLVTLHYSAARAQMDPTPLRMHAETAQEAAELVREAQLQHAELVEGLGDAYPSLGSALEGGFGGAGAETFIHDMQALASELRGEIVEDEACGV